MALFNLEFPFEKYEPYYEKFENVIIISSQTKLLKAYRQKQQGAQITAPTRTSACLDLNQECEPSRQQKQFKTFSLTTYTLPDTQYFALIRSLK